MKSHKALASVLLLSLGFMWENLSALEKKTINLPVNEAEAFSFDEPVSELFVANPAVADVQLSNSKLAYIFGKAPGRTNVFATSATGKHLLSLTLNVIQNVEQLQELLDAVALDSSIKVRATSTGIVLEGKVDDAKTAEDLRSIAQNFVGKDGNIINRLTVRAPLQVNLRVKVAEVKRSVINQFNFDWLGAFSGGDFSLGLLSGRSPFTTAGGKITPSNIVVDPAATNRNNTFVGNFTNKNWNVDSAIDSLSTEGLVTVLAEPNLIAVSGETASFLAGGEFPYPVPQGNNQITIEFKQFGVSLAFTPTVIDGNLISMRVRPEVSELDSTTGLKFNGFEVPGISTRRAETSIELASGQTFAIAGLLKNTVSSEISGLPGWEDIPILGTLFRSNAFQRGDSELVFIVTPYIVQPVSGKEMALPTDGLQYATFVEQIFERKLTKTGVDRGAAPALGPSGLRLIGPAGFSIDQ
ncbi:Flp pilus assembly protein CpaC [Candidatus Bealeia paramacronuclearis]|uniref:Flp pilus assembly protein CpaC n=1 Tax=Candidatus Bealeia paramacronuclearis TaxID=1921001 RepID=A0ABZ2C384_9PROT|nr:Flp pilus assembly protein CpaC [Candidatus Bealeia paramacronuclearis]